VANYVNDAIAQSNVEEVTLEDSPLQKETPVMQPVNNNLVNLTSFRADWTHGTPVENVASYTLEVSAKPEIPACVELENADFSNLTAQLNSSNQYSNQVSNASSFLPSGWTATTGLFIDDGAIISGQLTQSSSSYNFTVATKTYDLTGYDKVTVVFNASIFSTNYGTTATVNVATSAGSQDVTVSGEDFSTFTVVLDCAASDKITFTGVSGLYCMSGVTIYAGDLNAQTMLAVSESGDANYRLIEGISPANKYYLVKNLAEGGTFLYRVKAVYIDNTESGWSNVEEVTLFANEHPYASGDVNHDGAVDIDDVTALINAVLGNDGDVCPICANTTDDGNIDIDDVTALINKVLGNESSASFNVNKFVKL